MKKCKCLRCGWEWLPRTEKPIMCPACKSRKWEEKPMLTKNREDKDAISN